MDHGLGAFTVMVLMISVLPSCHSSWFGSYFSSTDDNDNKDSMNAPHDSSAEFSMEGFSDTKGLKLVEKARGKLVGSNSCWENAYRQLLSGCSKILAVEEKRSRFAWLLADCFQRDSGRPPFPFCDENSRMVNCLKKINDNEHKIFLEFLLETNSICHQLQIHSFKFETERLVNELRSSALYTEEQLEIIKDKTYSLLQSSNKIHDSLNSVEISVQTVAHVTKNVEDRMDVLSKHSEAVLKQSGELASSQSALQEGQTRMNENLKEGMSMLHDAYTNLGQEVDKLRDEANEIEKEIGRVGETMSSKMQDLQTTAEDIENKAGKSLSKQDELIEGQSTALKGLQLLTESQSQALEESRRNLERLAEYGREQQEILLQKQEQLQRVHDHLVQNSKSILAAQEEFESKQASMFVALDRLFALHNAMLLESRIIKSCFIYFMSVFVIYMFTSTKQTYTVRATLYIGLCATLLIEIAVLRLTRNSVEQQTWLINSVRLLYLLLASIQFLYAIYTYRDYEVLNHNMIQTLMEKVNTMQRKNEYMALESTEEYSLPDSWPSWIESELPEDVNKLEDPDFVLPEEIGENSIATTTPSTTTSSRYNLRRRTSRRVRDED